MTEEQNYILSRVKVAGECWIWQGATDQNGYGNTTRKGRSVKAHRRAYEAWKGSVPEGMGVLHNCPTGDNPACCNPAHLWTGTQADNSRDMCEKGRSGTGTRQSVTGERNPKAKLNESQVREIRKMHATGRYRYEDIAPLFGVQKTLIGQIVRRESWSHVK